MSKRFAALVAACVVLLGAGALARCELEPRHAAASLAAIAAPRELPPDPVTTTTAPPATTTTQPAPVPTTAPHHVKRPVVVHSSSGHWHPGGPCPSPSQCPQLRACENGGSYSHGTSPQFDGAYQFDHGSQWGMTPAQQDARADAMYADRGADPWPTCGRYLR